MDLVAIREELGGRRRWADRGAFWVELEEGEDTSLRVWRLNGGPIVGVTRYLGWKPYLGNVGFLHNTTEENKIECPICKDFFWASQRVAFMLYCFHPLHRQCLESHLLLSPEDAKKKCQMCQRDTVIYLYQKMPNRGVPQNPNPDAENPNAHLQLGDHAHPNAHLHLGDPVAPAFLDVLCGLCSQAIGPLRTRMQPCGHLYHPYCANNVYISNSRCIRPDCHILIENLAQEVLDADMMFAMEI